MIIKKQILITLLCASLIFITPFIGVAQENKINNNLTEQQDIEEHITNLHYAINSILEKYGHIPIIKTLSNRILGILDTIGLFVFCFVFGLLVALPLAILMLILFFSGITDYYFGQIIFIALFSIFFIWDYNCNFITFPVDFFVEKSLNPILTLLETNEIFNLDSDCPCLQE